MKNNLPVIKKLLIIVILIMITSSLSAQYNGGTGSENNPYQIASLDNLRTLSLTATDWNKNFILTANIDAGETQNWNNGKGFSPVGRSDTAFTGSFDGGGFSINNLSIHRSSTMYNGLFGRIIGSVIKNLTLNNFYIDGGQFSGGLVGTIQEMGTEITEISDISITNCTLKGGPLLGGLAGSFSSARIHNCDVTVTIMSGLGLMGGLAGSDSYGQGSELKNCTVTIDIKGISSVVGGLIGSNSMLIKDCQVYINADVIANNRGSIGGFTGMNSGTIENCNAYGEIVLRGQGNYSIGGFTGYNSGTLNSCNSSVSLSAENSYNMGGLVGENHKIIKNCFFSGGVVGKDHVGGLTGLNSADSQITNCYTAGMVTGEETIGGFLGENDDNTIVSNCYATCVVSGLDITGGFIGENNYFAEITNCYSSGEVNSEGWFSGGFAGLNRSSAVTINCFFDKETSGKTTGIGMDHNGFNTPPVGLTTNEFNNKNIFLDGGWSFGNSNESPWKMGTAPDSLKRPVLFYHNYLVKFLANEGGVVGPDSLLEQTINCGCNSDTILATPDEYFVFVKWQTLSGDSITNINPIAVENVISDSTLIAVFHSTFSITEIPARHVNIYPNPVTDILNIELDENFIFPNTIIELIDINGKQVLKFNPVSVSSHLDTKHLTSGLYLLKIQDDHILITKRIVKLSD